MPNQPLVVEQVEEGVLRLVGPLTISSLSPFENAVRRIGGNIILDLTHVPYVDSAGLGALVGAYTSYHKSGRAMVLSGVNDRVLKLLQITRLESLFPIFPTLGDAVQAITNSAQA
jgi:anti-sigma B factor antagonist